MATPEKASGSDAIYVSDISSNQGNEVIKDDGKIQTDEQGFAGDVEHLPKGYYYSPFFIGTCFAVGFGAWAGNAGFAYAAPILSTINADIG